VGFGWLLAQFYTPASFRILGEILAPVSRLIGDVLVAVLTFIMRLIEPAMLFLIDLLRQLFSAVSQTLPEGALGAPEFDFPEQAPREPGFPWGEVLQWMTLAGVVALAVLLIVRSIRKSRQRPEATDSAVEQAVLPLQEWGEDLLRNLRAGAGRLGDALAMLRHYRLGMELYAAISIRYIYANMVRVAAAAGYPRHAASTPFEYLGLLRQPFADVESEMRRITDAYVAVHYGEAPSTLAELQEIRSAWDRVRAHITESDGDAGDP
jgi:hypothetical protein